MTASMTTKESSCFPAPRVPSGACMLRLKGECVTLRPIGQHDAGALQDYFRGLSVQSRYNRFLGALQELPPTELDRVIHLDRKYELALLTETKIAGNSVAIGEARYAHSPERRESEFAPSVAEGWRGKGLGTLLIAELESRVRKLGARQLVGDVLRSNEPMKALARRCGFLTADVPGDARLVRIVKTLAPLRDATAPELAIAACRLWAAPPIVCDAPLRHCRA
jgi:GNAT superfamily N-acetyltransferase